MGLWLKIRGEGGFSLVGVLVAVGLAGLAAGLAATQYAQVRAVTKGTLQRDQRVSLRSLVRQTANCKATMAGHACPAPGTFFPLRDLNGAVIGTSINGSMWRAPDVAFAYRASCIRTAGVKPHDQLLVEAVPVTTSNAFAMDATKKQLWTWQPLFDVPDVTCESAIQATKPGSACVAGENSIGGFCATPTSCATGGGVCAAVCPQGTLLLGCNIAANSYHQVQYFLPSYAAGGFGWCTCNLGPAGGTCFAYCARPQ